MKKVLYLLIGICLTTGLRGQDQKKYWSDGKLTWDDFMKKRNVSGVSELKYFLGYHSGKQTYGDTTVVRVIAFCYMDKSLSWINPEWRSDHHLTYNQVIFDIAEMYRRKLQHELDRGYTMFGTDNIFSSIYRLCTADIEQFQRESNGGQDIHAISFWQEKISNALAVSSDERLPNFSTRNFGYGMHAGLGYGSTTGTLADHFSQTFNFIFGFDLAYKKSILFLAATLGGGKVKQDYLSERNWYKGQRAGLAIIDVSYGYAIVDNGEFKLTPFAGLGITELSGKNRDNEEDGLRLVAYSPILGINADYKIKTRLNLIASPFAGIKEKVETSIRARLYVTRVNYYSDLNGYSINLTVGFCAFGNILRLDH